MDILVKEVNHDVKEFEEKGGKILVAPFDIAIGRCAVVQDLWKNEFVLLDLSKGTLKTDPNGNVI